MAPHERFVLHQRRARRLVAHLLRRTAHVDVDDLRAGVDVTPRGLRHHLRIAACDLHGARRRFADMVDAPPRFFRVTPADDAGQHLGDGDACAHAPAQLPERPIGDAGHRCEREKVRQQGGADAHSPRSSSWKRRPRTRCRGLPRRHTSKRKPSASGPGSTIEIVAVACCAGHEQAVRRSRRIQIFRRLELRAGARDRPSDLPAPASAADTAAQSWRTFFRLARTLSVPGGRGIRARCHCRISYACRFQSGCRLAPNAAVEADDRPPELWIACQRVPMGVRLDRQQQHRRAERVIPVKGRALRGGRAQQLHFRLGARASLAPPRARTLPRRPRCRTARHRRLRPRRRAALRRPR